jgi:GT2 family glycosyltransferase
MKGRVGSRSFLDAVKRRLLRTAAHDPAAAKDADILGALRRFMEERSGIVHAARETALVPEILVPCFNHGRYLQQALESVADSNVQMTIINDKSTDDTPAYISGLRKRFTFKLIENATSLRQWGSLNRAILVSESNLFIVLNADDVFLPYALDLILRTFGMRTDIRMLGASCLPFAEEGILRLSSVLPRSLPYQPSLRLYGPEQAQHFKSLNDLNMTMSGCSFLRSAWGATGGFKPLAERVCSHDDRDFQMRVASLFEVAVMDEPLAYYRTYSSMGRGKT